MHELSSLPPWVSVVIPSYNNAHYVADAMRSVLVQTDVPLELIVVDDGSNDDTQRVIATHAEPRVRSIRHAVNAGMFAAVDTGLAAARGEFISILAADDRQLPGHLARAVSFYRRRPDIDYYYTRFLTASADLQRHCFLDSSGYHGLAYFECRNDWLANFEHFGHILMPASVVRRSIFDRFGSLNAAFPTMNDLEFVLRLAEAGCRIAYEAVPSITARRHAEQRSDVDALVGSGRQLREFAALAAHLSASPRIWEVAPHIERILTTMHAGYLAYKHERTAEMLARTAPDIAAFRERAAASAALHVGTAVTDSITVIVPTDGDVRFLPDALDSLLAQSDSDVDILVVDYGLGDLRPFLELRADRRRFRYAKTAAGASHADACNAGLDLANGTIVAYLDATDVAAPGRIARLRRVFDEDPALGVAICTTRGLILDRPDVMEPVAARVLDAFEIEAPRDPWLGTVVPVPALSAFAHRNPRAARFDDRLAPLDGWDFITRFGHARGAIIESIDVTLRRVRPAPGAASICERWLTAYATIAGRLDAYVSPAGRAVRERYRAAVMHAAAGAETVEGFVRLSRLFYGLAAQRDDRVATPAPLASATPPIPV